MMASAHLVAAGRPIRLRYALGWYAGRAAWISVCALAALSAIAATALLALVASNYRPMVLSTSTMSPTFGTGDVIVSEVVPPSAVRVGDVVTYEDSLRSGALITERVMNVVEYESSYAFTTKGDASSTEETWTIDEGSSVGRVAYRVPVLGSALSGLGTPPAQAALLIGVAVLLVGPVARRVRSELRT